MFLTLNIGNTNTQLAYWNGPDLAEITVCPTAELSPAHIPDGITAAATCVVPEVRKKLAAARDIFWVGPAMRFNVDTSAMDMSTVGADRLANIVFLAEYAKSRPALCLDFGTAVTLEVIDGRNRFIGGAIAPGRMLLRKSLHSYTAQLPLIPMFHEVPAGTGINTLDAIRLGVDGGAIGMAREMIASVQRMFPADPLTAVGIGGDAEFFCKAITDITYGGPAFTLHGVKKSWELNHEN